MNKELWPEKVENLLLKKLVWKFNRLELYQEALTHSSFAHEKEGRLRHNERLEFLGDAVLELIVSDYLYRSYPHFPEGKLTKLRSDLVCKDTLVQGAYGLNLGDYLRLGKGEAGGGGHSRPSLLADTVEALIGALYLDVGFDRCYLAVVELLRPILQALEEGVWRQDYKTLLQEYAQARYNVTPLYSMAGESGPDHEKMFHARVLLNGKVLGRGSGRSKKEAQQEAAREAWNNLN